MAEMGNKIIPLPHLKFRNGKWKFEKNHNPQIYKDLLARLVFFDGIFMYYTTGYSFK